MLFLLSFMAGIAICFFVVFFWPKSTTLNSKTETNHLKQMQKQLIEENQKYKQEEKKWIEQCSSLNTENKNLKEQHAKDLANQQMYHEKSLQEKEQSFQNKEEHLKQMKLEFENIANKILQSKKEHYQQESEKSLSQLLNPLKEKISSFEQTIQKSSGERQAQILSLKEEIKTITATHQNLTEALKGNTKVQGDWGETILERILEDSGLQFETQKNLKSEDGKTVRPDVCIPLPQNRFVIIDSKVTLTHYHSYIASKSEKEKSQYISQITASLTRHINELSEKHYHNAQDTRAAAHNQKTLDFVLMFVPLEGPLSLALQSTMQQGKNLFAEALEKKVMMVSPLTLHATLKIIDTLWKLDKQNKNAEKIAKASGKMYDSLIHFVNHMLKVGKGLNTAQEFYDKAMKKLTTGRGNLISKAEDIKKLRGDNTKKRLPIATEKEDDQSLKEVSSIDEESSKNDTVLQIKN